MNISMNSNIKLGFFMMCMIISIASYAKTGRLYSSDQLTSNRVRNICQDKYGYIWIGTDFGLNRFDGYRFVNYLNIRGDTTSIISNQIASIFADSQGRLWIGFSNGLACYDYSNENFVRYRFPRDVMPRVCTITENRDGDIYFGTAGFGLFVLKRKSKSIKSMESVNANIDGFCTQLFIDSHETLFSSSNENCFEVFRLNGDKISSHKCFETSHGVPVAFAECDSIELYIVCQKGIMIYNRLTGKTYDSGISLQSNESVNFICAKISHDGSLLIGTSGNGVYRVDRHQKKGFKEDFSIPQFRVSNTTVNYIFEDKKNNLCKVIMSATMLQA